MKKYDEIRELIINENRNEAVTHTLQLLEEERIDIVTLYQNVLSGVLTTIDCNLSPDECIWREHVRSAIVRTVMEASFPHVIKVINKVKKIDKKVLIVCPSEEYHEIGAKMAYDFFLMNGYDAIFIGANTPTEEIVSAVRYARPDYLAISVTDKYNIIKARQVVAHVKKEKEDLKIIVGGLAFSDSSVRKQIEHDAYLTGFDSIRELGDL